MEAGAAEQAARGQCREWVTDRPLIGASAYKHAALADFLAGCSARRPALRLGGPRAPDELAADVDPPATRPRSSLSRVTNTPPQGCLVEDPEPARQYLNQRARQPEIGTVDHSAMDLIEVDNSSLRCMVPTTYAGLQPRRPAHRRARRPIFFSTGDKWPRLRVLPPPCAARAKSRGEVLHTSVRRQAARGDAGADEQANVRMLRLSRHGREAGWFVEVHGGQRRALVHIGLEPTTPAPAAPRRRWPGLVHSAIKPAPLSPPR